MKNAQNYIIFGAFIFISACGSSKKMSLENWESDSHIEKTLYTSEEVDEIVTAILNSEQKDRPYQAPADKIWQLVHTDLQIKVDFKDKTLDGNATLSLKPYYYPQQELILDAKGMDIFAVELAEQNGPQTNQPKPDPLIWSYTDSLHLHIRFPYIMNQYETVKIRIDYQANPERKLSQSINLAHTAVSDDKGVYFINTDGSNPGYAMQVWTQGEPESNSRWFPTIDNPNQKHTHRFTLEYPDTLTSISNGHLMESKLIGKGLKKDIWEMRDKHAVYLSMFAIGSWEALHDTAIVAFPESFEALPIPLRYYVEPAYKAYAKEIFGNTPEMIRFFSTITGVPYPWNKYDQIVCREFVSGAIENTTAVIHNDRLQDPSYEMEDYIAHELFHHWFGDYATCESWGHLSMNESFATYSEYLWREHKYGKNNAEEWLYDNTTYPYLNDEGLPSEELETTPLINPHFKHANDQFDDIRYNKGAQILHELRNLIGMNAFSESMKCYLSQHAYKNGNAYDWKKCIETVTGKNMDHFFNSWYFQGGEFKLLYRTGIDSASGRPTLVLNPGIAENEMSVSVLKSYGRAKTQQVYFHVLGKNNQTWDTSLMIYPYHQTLNIALPFADSIVLVTYTNPQNYNYTFNTDLREKANIYNVSLFPDFLRHAHYALKNERFSYFEKVNIIGKAFREINTFGVSSYDLTSLMVEMAVKGLQIDRIQKNARPLLSKLNFEIVQELYRNHSLKNPQQLQLLQNYYDSVFAIFTTESRMEHQVYYFNFLQQLESNFSSITPKSNRLITKPISDKWLHGNSLTLLDAALMESYFNKGNMASTIQIILNSVSNSMPIKARFLNKLWDESLVGLWTAEEKIATMPVIAKLNWSNDLLLKWLDRAFINGSREESLILDAWVQQLKTAPRYTRTTQFHFQNEWQSLQLEKSQSNLQDPSRQLRYSILESLFSIKSE